MTVAAKKRDTGRGGTQIVVDAAYVESFVAAAIGLAKAKQVAKGTGKSFEGSWEEWLLRFFPKYVTARDGSVSFATFHREFWEWAWSIERGLRPPPFVAIWPRGAAKSTSVELAVASWACLQRRKYVVYVSESQDQADDHVGNIASLLENEGLAQGYPEVGDRAVGKYGNVKGWRRNRIRTASGFIVDALGLDVAARGAKIDEDRPDAIVFDDVDSREDSQLMVQKKIRTITTKLGPAGAEDCVFMFVQNLIHPESIASRLVDGRADFFHGRIVSGPFPALTDAAIDPVIVGDHQEGWKIVAGTPTWDGMSVERCQAILDDIGKEAFEAECQHDVTAPAGGMFNHVLFRHPTTLPELVEVVVAIDPAVTDTDQSDANGVTTMARGVDGLYYVLYSWERRAGPSETIKVGIRQALIHGATRIVLETNNGGDVWVTAYPAVWATMVKEGEIPPERKIIDLMQQKAGSTASKAERASRMLVDYEEGSILHYVNGEGTHRLLEAALHRFPTTKPLDLVDSEYWAWLELSGAGGKWAGWSNYLKHRIAV